MAGKKESTKIGRSAKSGQFVSKDYAKKHPATTVVDTVKPPSKKKKTGSTQSTGPRVK